MLARLRSVAYSNVAAIGRDPDGIRMPTVKIVFWEDDGFWIGYLQEFPDYWTQGDTLEDLESHLRALYKDLTSGELRGIRRVADIAVA